MANSYFRFKQFTINQDKCALKVCTDTCLFGALTSTLSTSREGICRILDIGTGTGLLSLMYAQKNPDAIIDAVEVDEAAARQAKENFEASPWNNQLNVYNTSIQKYANTNNYDIILCNPPFFVNNLKSNNDKRNIALHNDALNFEELFLSAQKFLSDNGSFAVMLPYSNAENFEALANQYKFYLKEKILIKQTHKHNNFRSIIFFVKQTVMLTQTEIIIKDKLNNYTTRFVELLKDYYLYL